LPPGVQGPAPAVLVQDIKIHADTGNRGNVFVHDSALLIYNPSLQFVGIVKEGSWGVYIEHNGVVNLGYPHGDQVALGNGGTERHFEHGYVYFHAMDANDLSDDLQVKRILFLK